MGEKINVTNEDLIKLHNALNFSLDGLKRGKEEAVTFEFTPEIRWNLAKNAGIVGRAKKDYDRAFRSICAANKILPGEKLTEANRDRVLKVNEEDAVLKDKEAILEGILYVTTKDLFNEREEKDEEGSKRKVKNEIPQSVLVGLLPIIKNPTGD